MLIKKHFSNELLHESPTVFTDLIKKREGYIFTSVRQ